jgi:hypothetical protein
VIQGGEPHPHALSLCLDGNPGVCISGPKNGCGNIPSIATGLAKATATRDKRATIVNCIIAVVSSLCIERSESRSSGDKVYVQKILD